MNRNPCTKVQLREEADALFGGSLDRLRQFIAGKVIHGPAMFAPHGEKDIRRLMEMVESDTAGHAAR